MIFGKKLFLFFKNNLTRINHCILIHHKSHLKPLLSYLQSIVHREYFSIIFNVKKCALYSIKYGKILHTIQNLSKNSHCKFVGSLASHGSTLVEHLPPHSKVKGLSPSNATDTGRGEMVKQGATTLSIMTFSITTISINGLYVKLSISDIMHKHFLLIC